MSPFYRGQNSVRLRTGAAVAALTLLAVGLSVPSGLAGPLKPGAPSTAGLTEFTPTDSGTTLPGITLGPDGNLWVAENNVLNGIGKIAPDGTWTSYPLPGIQPNFPAAITTGPDGNLWFIEQSAISSANVGRI